MDESQPQRPGPIRSLFYGLSCVGFLVSFVFFCTVFFSEKDVWTKLPIVAVTTVFWVLVKALKPVEVKTKEQVSSEKEAREVKQAELEAFREEFIMSQNEKRLKKAGLVCPKCGSHDVMHLGSTSKPFSPGKAVAGSLVAGVPGALLGASMGTKGKNEWVCCSCGHRYKAK